MLIDIINQSPYAFYFLNIDQFLDLDFSSLKNFVPIYAFNNSNISKLKESDKDYFCLEENGQKIEVRNSGYLLKQTAVIDFIKNHSQSKKLTPVIVPFKASSKIEHICKDNNWIYAAIPAKLNRLLEDKISFYQLCQNNELPIVPSAIDKFNQGNFQKYQQQLDNKLVVQGRFSWSGKKTFLAEDWSEIKDKITLESSVKYSPFLNGYSLTNNCVLTKQGLIQSPPALQFNNVPTLSENPFTTVGRQWPSLAPIEIIEQIKNLTEEFSKILIDLNYQGFFGLDFLVSQDKVYFLESNPRLTASIDFYSKIEITNDINPLFLFHLIQFLPLEIDINIELENKRFYNSNIIGSEITKKDSQNDTVKRYRDFITFSKNNYPIEISPQIIEKVNDQE